jgi:hypothetical protein
MRGMLIGKQACLCGATLQVNWKGENQARDWTQGFHCFFALRCWTMLVWAWFGLKPIRLVQYFFHFHVSDFLGYHYLKINLREGKYPPAQDTTDRHVASYLASLPALEERLPRPRTRVHTSAVRAAPNESPRVGTAAVLAPAQGTRMHPA